MSVSVIVSMRGYKCPVLCWFSKGQRPRVVLEQPLTRVSSFALFFVARTSRNIVHDKARGEFLRRRVL